MSDKPIFEFDDSPAAPAGAPAPDVPARPAAPDIEIDSEASGARLADDMLEKGYQPVVLFGNAFSGKTSLLLSLLATVKTEPSLNAGVWMAEPLLARDTRYGRFQAEQAEAFFERKVQDFIEGTASPKTAIELPFFVPVNLRPADKPQATFAFMESNGEWYRPDRSGERLHPRLRAQIEDFIASYQGGIIFVHLLPYTQQAVRSANADSANDASEVRDAALAVEGAVRAYERVRVDKRADVHIMLVTKWDAHKPALQGESPLEEERRDEMEAFAAERYAKAVSALRGMGLAPGQVFMNAYCAGLINERGVVTLKPGNPMRELVLRFPINMWRFLYRRALFNAGMAVVDPFPAPPTAPWWKRLLERVF